MPPREDFHLAGAAGVLVPLGKLLGRAARVDVATDGQDGGFHLFGCVMVCVYKGACGSPVS